MAGEPLQEALTAALRTSIFARLSPAVTALIVAGAKLIEFEHGQVVYATGDKPQVLLVIEGMLRDYLISPDGREATASYLAPGDLSGIFTLGQGNSSAVNVQALTKATVLELVPGLVERLASQHATLAWELEQELVRRWAQTLDAMSVNTFGTVRQRIVRHLLFLARWSDQRGRFVAMATHQEVADAVGSVRDVVGRELRTLQNRGHIELSRGFITYRDPVALESELRSVLLSATIVRRDSPPAG